MSADAPDPAALARTHVRFGWWALLVFLSLGFALEAMHGFKVRFYLDVTNETRRLMWTLAHTHGTLLALVQLAYAASLGILPDPSPGKRRLASRALRAANVLLPGGFFLGGVWVYGGDPGVGILLVPAGALALFVGVLLTALGARAAPGE